MIFWSMLNRNLIKPNEALSYSIFLVKNIGRAEYIIAIDMFSGIWFKISISISIRA